MPDLTAKYDSCVVLDAEGKVSGVVTMKGGMSMSMSMAEWEQLRTKVANEYLFDCQETPEADRTTPDEYFIWYVRSHYGYAVVPYAPLQMDFTPNTPYVLSPQVQEFCKHYQEQGAETVRDMIDCLESMSADNLYQLLVVKCKLAPWGKEDIASELDDLLTLYGEGEKIFNYIRGG